MRATAWLTLLVLASTAAGCGQDEESGFFVSYTNPAVEIVVGHDYLSYTRLSNEFWEEHPCGCTKYSNCWTDEDLTTTEVSLAEEDTAQLLEAVVQSGFLDLDEDSDSADPSGDYSARTIAVAVGELQHTVVYRPYDTDAPKPASFKEVEGQLFDLAESKMPEKSILITR